jgi:hypothetical protein
MAKIKVCEGKTKAKFLIKFKDGKREEVECSAPAFIELKDDVPNSTGTEEYIVEGTYTSTIAGCGSNTFSTFLPGPGIKLKREEGVIGEFTVVGYYVTNAAGFRAEISGKGTAFQGFKENFETHCEDYGSNRATGHSPTITVIKKKDDTTDEPKCLIIITNSEGKEVYKKSAECPIKWGAACEEGECPGQHLRCRSSTYPGYRCVPCNEFGR